MAGADGSLPRPCFAAPPASALWGAFSSWSLVVASVLAFLVAALRIWGGIDPDVASQLWIAGRINEGARLYRDILEVNPPLWFWMAVPVDRLASLLHLPAVTVLTALFGPLVVLALAATDRLLAHIPRLCRARACAHAIDTRRAA